jgi:predicted permease
MGAIFQDLKYASRMLRKSPGFTLVVVLTLALGIGANTAIFSMVDSFLLRPLPVKDGNQLVVLAFQQSKGPIQGSFSLPECRDLQAQTGDVFDGLTGYELGLDGLSVNGKAERVLTYYVTGNFFSMLGIKPALGRFILPGEGETLGADPVIVLGYAYWKVRFGGDPGVLGQKVLVNARPVTIVGVAPEGFYGIFTLTTPQGYLPLGMALTQNPDDFMTNRGYRNFSLLARLKPGASIAQANASLAVIARRLAQDHPDVEKDMSISAYPEVRSRPSPDSQNPLALISSLFLGLALVVLVLACMNVANILLVRSTIREREMAIRAALGAGRGRLMRQLLTESILLAVLGGAAGILLGAWGSATVGSIRLGVEVPVHVDFGLDWRVFAFAFGAALCTGLIIAVVPAMRIARSNLSMILHEGGRSVAGGRHRVRSILVAAQVAGSLMLLIIAGLFARSLQAAQHTDLGFRPEGVVDLSMDPAEIGYNETRGLEFLKTTLDRVRELPGVKSAGFTTSVPLGYFNSTDSLIIEGFDSAPGQAAPYAVFAFITPDYLETLQIPLLRGRQFADADNASTPYVAIVNETMVKRYWHDVDPIGRSFRLGGDMSHPIQIVGIAKNSRYNGATGGIGSSFYLPLAQHYTGNSLVTLQVRSAAPPEEMMREIERLLGTLAPDLPVFDVKTFKDALETLNGLLIYKLGAWLAAAMGLLGLILAVVGVYGVISYAASQKTHEIGIRMALGARPADILRMVFGEGLLIVAGGIIAGLAAAFAFARLVNDFIAVSAADPFTYVMVTLLLASVALAACWIPARRSMRVDPMVALRHE